MEARVGGGGGRTYIKAVDGAKARQPEDALPQDAVDKQILAGEERLAEALRLGLLAHLGGAREEGILAHEPVLAPIDMQRDDVAKERRPQGHAPGPRVRRLGHAAARDELLHGELHLARQLHRARHVDHGSGLGAHRGALLQADVEDGVGVAVADAVGAAGEAAAVTLLGCVLG